VIGLLFRGDKLSRPTSLYGRQVGRDIEGPCAQTPGSSRGRPTHRDNIAYKESAFITDPRNIKVDTKYEPFATVGQWLVFLTIQITIIT